MPVLRLTRIAWAFSGLLVCAAWQRLRGRPGEDVPERLARALEWLGPTFVKLGQALSMRRDVLPDAYIEALHRLQEHVAPFPGDLAEQEIERALGRPIEMLFDEFEAAPFAAASVAQVHRARMKDGREVIVKVRRPHIARQIDRDLKALRTVVRVLVTLAAGLRRFQPARLLDELAANLRRETDFRQEARNIARFAAAFSDRPTVYVPMVIDGLYSESVLVQELSHGRAIDDPEFCEDGPRLAQLLVDLYLDQFFVVGLFHGDPHPGNLFVMPDGRICFHDFGLTGFLDRPTRRSLAMFLHAFAHQDAGWTLDAAIDLGVLGGEMDRAGFRRGIEEILADYATLPLKEWSLAEAFLRVARLGQGTNFAIPHNLVVLMRTLFLIENLLRTIDPEFRILDALLAHGREKLGTSMRGSAGAAALARLEHEAALTLEDLPALAGVWLHRAQHERAGIPVTVTVEGLETASRRLERTGKRLALALLTLGLYVAASLLMQHSIGPRLYPARSEGGRPDRQVRRLVLYVPRLALRHLGPGAPRPGTGEPHGAPVPTPGRCAGRDRMMRVPPPILSDTVRAGANRAARWGAALLVVAAVLIAPAKANDPLGLDLMALGETIPAFDLPPVENGEPGLSDTDLTGQVSLLNVWASWCPPCRDEHPVLMDLAERDLVPLFGLNYKDAAPSAAQWLRDVGDPYQSTGFDGDGRVTTELGLFGVPQTFVIDRAGRIAYVHRGALDEDAVERIILPLVERLSRQDGAAPKQPAGRRSTGRSP